MLVTKGIKIKGIKSHPGNIIVIGDKKDIYIINVYKMMTFKHFQIDIDGCHSIIFKDKNLIICGKFIFENINLFRSEG